ncbi:MAG: aminotransferase class I/II-fold pyridoxal phosphate-dependent enzyme [Planctomycetota bacterium]
MSPANVSDWIADRTRSFDSSGIRRVFDLAAKLEDPINLSIGQPDFDVPDAVKDAAVEAIQSGRNAYSPTQGIGPLREALRAELKEQYPDQERDVFVSSGTSGGLMLTMLSLINPGDEVVFLDPYFVMYPALVQLCGGVPVLVDSYPDFRLDPGKIEAAITERTKLILINSPGNPTGVTASKEDVKTVAEMAGDRGIAVLSDEIYSRFHYDEPAFSAAAFNEQSIVIDGFSKSHAMTGWRVGWVHGPPEVIATMLKIQQYSFVCAPQPAQWGALRAMEVRLDAHLNHYRQKRDYMVGRLSPHFELTPAGGAFYLFPKAPNGITGTEFVTKAIESNVLVIPGSIFSQHDTHFRISFAASDETLERGADALIQLAKSI